MFAEVKDSSKNRGKKEAANLQLQRIGWVVADAENVVVVEGVVPTLRCRIRSIHWPDKFIRAQVLCDDTNIQIYK